jgi:hypothetical protein
VLLPEAWAKFLGVLTVQGIAAFAGAVVGALIPLLFSLWLYRKSEKQRLTLALIDEYLSSAFLRHRIVVANVRGRIQRGEVSLESVASGFWYPGTGVYHAGEVTDGLNEHQHIEVVASAIKRIAHHGRSNRVNWPELRGALRDKHIWIVTLLYPLAKKAKQIAQANNGRSTLFDDVVYVNNMMRIDTTKDLLLLQGQDAVSK